MRRYVLTFMSLCFFPFSMILCASAQEPPSASQPHFPTDVPNSIQGFQSQVDELVRAGKTHDQATWRTALDSFALPDAKTWLGTNFLDKDLAEVTQDYTKVSDGQLGHISWVLGQYVDQPGFAIHVESSEMPPGLASTGFESLIPRPLHAVSLHNFRLTASAAAKSNLSSWVGSFVYLEGHFRVVGGTYPFWAEKLTPFRGPMALPVASVRGMTVQGIAFRHDEKRDKIVGIVQLKINVAKDGHVSKIKVLSGDESFVEDAKKYIQSADFGAMPDDPRLANARREWEFEVAFFSATN